jgi:hypothetical protein
MPTFAVPHQQAFIELILIGMRDLAPYNFQAMSAPFLEIELNSFGSTYLSTTASSKRPEPENPNFLEKIIMPVELPEHSVFASPLQVCTMVIVDVAMRRSVKEVVEVCGGLLGGYVASVKLCGLMMTLTSTLVAVADS